MSINQQNHVFIDPEECGSSVGYHLTLSEFTSKNSSPEFYVSATVVLADCNRKIDWSFADLEANKNIEKIDAAIGMLQEFRKKYLDAHKMVTKLNKK